MNTSKYSIGDIVEYDSIESGRGGFGRIHAILCRENPENKVYYEYLIGSEETYICESEIIAQYVKYKED